MILDSSAIVAIVNKEPGHLPLLQAVAQSDQLGIGSPTLTETGIVLTARLGILGKTLLSRFIQETATEVLPFGELHWPVAIDAYMNFGKGRHPAALNFGDCLTYAIAKVADQSLLCIGNDFAQTDLSLVLNRDPQGLGA